MTTTRTPRAGSVHTLRPAGLLDTGSARVTAHTGHVVQVTIPSVGRPGRAQVYVSCLTCTDRPGKCSYFLGMVNTASLSPADIKQVRGEMVKRLHAWAAPADEGYQVVRSWGELARAIRALSSLGTGRWAQQAERWAKLVEDSAGHDRAHGYLQGSVWFAHGTDGLMSLD